MNGGFSFASTLTVGSGPYSVSAADINRDGKLDLFSANQLGANVSVFTNNGHGSIGRITPAGVVTTLAGGDWHGMTASSFSSVSADPPLVSVCLLKKLYTHELFQTSGVFGVNILAKDQTEVGKRFAGMNPEITDRFDGRIAALAARLAAARGLALATGTKLWGADSLAVMAQGARAETDLRQSGRPFAVAVDARRSMLYFGLFAGHGVATVHWVATWVLPALVALHVLTHAGLGGLAQLFRHRLGHGSGFTLGSMRVVHGGQQGAAHLLFLLGRHQAAPRPEGQALLRVEHRSTAPQGVVGDALPDGLTRKITGMPCVAGVWRNFCKSSMPFRRGILMSSTARSTGRASKPCRAASPSA